VIDRRQFIAMCSAAAFAAEPMPHDTLRAQIEPGHDAFPQERIAQEVAAQLRKARPGRYYCLPNNNRQDPNFGIVTSTQAGSERHLQFALRLEF